MKQIIVGFRKKDYFEKITLRSSLIARWKEGNKRSTLRVEIQ